MEPMAGTSNKRQGQQLSHQLIASLHPMQCVNVLNHVIIHQSDFVSTEVVKEAKLALWEGLQSSPLGLRNALLFWISELQYVVEPQNKQFRVLLRSKKSRTFEINIGECATLQDVSEIKAALHACKVDFSRTIRLYVSKMGASPQTFLNLDIHSLMSAQFTPRDVSGAKKPSVMKRYYSCCKVMEESRKEEFVLFEKLECLSCHRHVHTECTLKNMELYLRKHAQTGMESSFYKCNCGTLHKEMIPNMLLLIKEFVNEIRAEHKHALRGTKVMELPNGPELGVVMEVILKILVRAKTEFLLSLSEVIARMKLELTMEARLVNFEQWTSFFDAALLCFKPDDVECQVRGRSKEVVE